jgi:hypothetical protein
MGLEMTKVEKKRRKVLNCAGASDRDRIPTKHQQPAVYKYVLN